MVVLDGVQDPGNAGAIVRAAEAFGATGVICFKGTVSPFNPKTLRASAGSLFRLPFVHGMDAALARAALAAERGGAVCGRALAAGHGAAATGRLGFDGGRAGSSSAARRTGLSEVLREAAMGISIPTAGVESLNAAVAAGILLYEAQRQRAQRQ